MYHGPIAVFDLETTDRDPVTARPVTCALGLLGHPIAEILVNPECEISAEATAIHQITTEHAAAHGQDRARMIPWIRDTLEEYWGQGIPVVIFNAPFDLTIINAELDRLALPPLRISHVIDPLVLDKHVDKYRKGRRQLATMCAHYGVPLGEAAHSCVADATATGYLGGAILRAYPELAEMDLAELHTAQARWFRDQATSLEAYFVRQGTLTEPVNKSWPVRPLGGADNCAR
jgi:DNA polymerase-3 subunit epsilon